MKPFYCLLAINLLLLYFGDILCTSVPYIPVTQDISVVRDRLRQIDQLIHELQDLFSNSQCFDYHQNKPKDCYDLKKNGVIQSGIYEIWPKNSMLKEESFQVYCDMETDGGGWTVFQRRGNYGNPSDYFYRDWKSYSDGFGELDGEFWLGNDKLHALTKQDSYSLRIDLKDNNGDTRYAMYREFRIGNEDEKYKLHVTGFSGNDGDSFSAHSGMNFSTKDKDSTSSCATTYKGAWWYRGCHYSNLNGLNLNGAQSSFGDGINWYSWKGYYYSIPTTEMKIRPVNY